jgi:hypothetical protein
VRRQRAIAGGRLRCSESIARPTRAGVIEEVIGHNPPRYRIRWDDGHESVYTPAAGALRKLDATK